MGASQPCVCPQPALCQQSALCRWHPHPQRVRVESSCAVLTGPVPHVWARGDRLRSPLALGGGQAGGNHEVLQELHHGHVDAVAACQPIPAWCRTYGCWTYGRVRLRAANRRRALGARAPRLQAAINGRCQDDGGATWGLERSARAARIPMQSGRIYAHKSWPLFADV